MKDLPIATGAHGKRFYVVDFTLRVVFHGSETVYELRHEGKGHGRVEAEYV